MQGFAGKVAVVTGAGSGIGQALAIELGRSGASVAISDVDTEGLAVTEERLKAIGVNVKADRLNVTEREAFSAYADEVKAHFGKVNQIYNNAGIAFSGDVEVSQFKDIERVMDVDFWGVVNGTKVFLPYLIESGDGHVVNISSLFGIFSVPGQAAYNSAKFAVRGFTEALRQEMILANHPVQVTTVHPGGIKTAIARNSTVAEGLDQAAMAQAFDKKLARTTPERAAQIILEAVRKKKARVLVGADAKILDVIVRITGSGYQDLFSACCPSCRRRRANAPTGARRASSRPPCAGPPFGDLAAQIHQCPGVQDAGEFVDRAHLLLVEFVAPVQRHDVLRLDQNGFAIGQHRDVTGHPGIGGAGPRRGDHPLAQCVE